jgi:hypothetical protein
MHRRWPKRVPGWLVASAYGLPVGLSEETADSRKEVSS